MISDHMLAMELRDVRQSERVVIGVAMPYDEVSYLVPDPMGERVMRGAFSRSVKVRGDKVPLLRGHDTVLRYGTSQSFAEDPEGLLGTFHVNEGSAGDGLLEDCRNGYLAGLSCGFRPVTVKRGADGVREVHEAALVEVSLVGVPAYAGAAMLAVRTAQPVMPAFPARPDVNLEPLPTLGYRSRS